MDTRINELLERKGPRLVTICPTATVFEALETMIDAQVGAVVVMDGSRLLGLFGERDYIAWVRHRKAASLGTKVGDVACARAHLVTRRFTVERCLALMTRERTRHLVVVEDDVVLGVISIGDCVAHLCEQLAVENGYLRDYIAGRYPG